MGQTRGNGAVGEWSDKAVGRLGDVWRLGMGTEFGTFIGTDRIPPEVPSIDSCEVNRYHISVPERTFTGIS